MKKVILSLVIAGLLLTSLPGCGDPKSEPIPFTLSVIPEQLNGHSIAGQRCVFLVMINEEGDNAPVVISATTTGAQVSINKTEISKGDVAEVVVIPAEESVGNTINIVVKGTREGLTDEKTVSFEVIEGEDDRQEYAAELLEKFTAWLSVNQPELGINEQTEWIGTMVSPQWLVVSHYLFFSEEWEAHISWHIMIAPSDWAQIDLRHRFDEYKPSYAFEIPSIVAGDNPRQVETPETVWR